MLTLLEETSFFDVSNPRLETSRVIGNFLEVVTENFPSASETELDDSPRTLMLAPLIGFLLLSVTEPVILFCAKEILQKNIDKISKYTFICLNLVGFMKPKYK